MKSLIGDPITAIEIGFFDENLIRSSALL